MALHPVKTVGQRKSGSSHGSHGGAVRRVFVKSKNFTKKELMKGFRKLKR